MKKFVVALGVAVLGLAASGQAAVIDAPHNDTNNIGCGQCHSYSLWWQYSPAGTNDPAMRGAITDAICATCHSGTGTAPHKVTHAAVNMGIMRRAELGDWGKRCVDCHDPHNQAQIDWAGSNATDLYLVTATIGAANTIVDNGNGTTTLEYTAPVVNSSAWTDPATWSDKSGSGRGLLLVDSLATAANTYPLVGATATTITVKGQLPTTSALHNVGLIYGQLIKAAIEVEAPSPANPAGVIRTVKFFDPKKVDGVGGFTDASATPEGICQVCHTQTHYYLQDGSLTSHNAGRQCTTCHITAQGFMPNFPDHSAAYVMDTPLCVVCHGANNMLAIHKSGCTSCHTTPPVLTTADTRRYVTTIARGQCVTCHSGYFAAHTMDHTNLVRVNSTQDTSMRNCTAMCHTTAITPPFVAAGQTHSALGCATCHDQTNGTLRSTTTGTAVPGGGECITCHPSVIYHGF